MWPLFLLRFFNSFRFCGSLINIKFSISSILSNDWRIAINDFKLISPLFSNFLIVGTGTPDFSERVSLERLYTSRCFLIRPANSSRIVFGLFPIDIMISPKLKFTIYVIS